jgi:hypothetical protein
MKRLILQEEFSVSMPIGAQTGSGLIGKIVGGSSTPLKIIWCC